MTSRRALRAGIGAVALAGIGRLVVTAPPAMLGLAVVPALVIALIVVLSDRRREPWTATVATFAWGAVVAAAVAAALNATLSGWLAGSIGASEGRALAPILVGPAVEEVAKAVALVVLLAAWRDDVDGVHDGVVYGALVGIGFAMAENVDYFTLAAVQGGPEGLGRSVYLRGLLGGLNHATFTATFGAGVGWAWHARAGAGRLVAPGLALVAATVEHVLWNGLAAGLIERRLCGAPGPAAPCRPTPALLDLLVSAPLVVVAFLGPVLATLLIVLARADRRPGSGLHGLAPEDRATPPSQRSHP